MLGPEDISVEEHSALMNVAPGQHETHDDVGSMLARTIMMGRSTTIPVNTTQTVVYTPVSETATDWEVHVQVTNLPVAVRLRVPEAAYGTVTYTLGEATFRKTFLIQTNAPYRFKVVGRRVQVDVTWIAGGTLALNVIAGCAQAGYSASPLDYYLPTWMVNNTLSATANVDVPGFWTPFTSGDLASMLISWQLMILAMPTGAGASTCCLMFFDTVDIGTIITGQLPIWVSPPLTAANQWYAFDDGTAPQVRYSSGLGWALSSTFDTYTTVGSGASARVDCKLGS